MLSTAIVQTAFIGDVILATPLFEAARKSRPDNRIIAVVREGCQNIIQNNPNVDELIVWDKRGKDRGLEGLLRIVTKLREFKIETALVPHRSIRSALAVYFSGAKKRIGFAKGGGAFLHTDRVPYQQGIHEVERNLMLAEEAGWESSGFVPRIFPDTNDAEIVDNLLKDIDRFCVLAPGSVWATKIWPTESYVEVGSALSSHDMRIIISGGSPDKNICRAVAEKIPGAVNTCGELTLRQSAELYRRSQFVLTGDTAPQHIAAAVGARVFSIFGPTVRDFGFWPYTERGVVIEENSDCRPCGIHGHKTCPLGTHECMKNITPQKVIKIISETMD